MVKIITAPVYKVLETDEYIKASCVANAVKVILPKMVKGLDVVISKECASANAVTIVPTKDDVLYDGIRQVETATVEGTITQSGDATIVFTSALIVSSPITLSVAVLVDDTPTIVARKIVSAMVANEFIAHPITGNYLATSLAGVITVTQREYLANDSTLNISIDNGTCTGLTTAATSANTTAGVSVTLATQYESKRLVCDGSSWYVESFAQPNLSETLTNKTIDASTNYLKNTVLAYAGRVTTAQLNAGITLVAAVAGRTIRVLGYSLVSNGDFSSGGGTSVIFQDTNGTPVVITTAAKAALTAGAKIASGTAIANITDGAGMVGNLTAAKGIAIKADAALSVGTSIDVTLYYMYV